MKKNKSLLILFLIMFLVYVGFGIMIPVLPFYAEEFGASPTELGLLMAVYSLLQLLFAPMWGRISDRMGRKPVMLIGIAGLAISFLMMAVSTNLWWLFAARIIGGFLSSATMPTTMAYVADITTPEDRGKGMGAIGAAIGLGFVFGPAIGGVFSKISLSLPFYIAAISSVVTLLLVVFLLKESLSAEHRREHVEKKISLWHSLSGAMSILFILQLFISLSLSGLEATFAYFAAKKAGMDATEMGYVFMIMGLAGAFVQGGLMGKLTKKYGEGPVIQAGIIISAIGFALILLVHNFTTAAIYLTIFGIGNGVIRPSISSLLTKTTTAGHGSATGLLSSFDSFGRIVGPPLGGWLYTIAIGIPYISGAIISLFAFVLYRIYIVKAKKVEVVSN
ncbi:MFS transporter [Bacillus sp. 1NLA3E]|uniref:MFS transporter n=1 Tax=Bacillus sp. 1NLA3E TaxID=666686 RepID=UPI000247F3EF|nr:tetracycline resistance MFS efflux pump [Bacillus sp. 1NLA3E]AGK53849.1 major facilitator superfamily protein [Bacillus sp. 1NLA3E]